MLACLLSLMLVPLSHTVCSSCSTRVNFCGGRLACRTCKSAHVLFESAGRKNPGLSPQHLTGDAAEQAVHIESSKYYTPCDG
jgi:hypothetical protein